MKKIFLLAFGILHIVCFANSKEANKKVGIKVGQLAPNIIIKDTQRESQELLELRNKIVLIHFWASWCSHCRKENPKLVQIYKRFHNKEFTQGEDFEIFAISMDKSEKLWKEAIKRDQLFLKYNVCDFKGWYGRYPTKYKVESLPHNILINGKGIVIGRDLSCKDLENKLITLSK